MHDKCNHDMSDLEFNRLLKVRWSDVKASQRQCLPNKKFTDRLQGSNINKLYLCSQEDILVSNLKIDRNYENMFSTTDI